jgi:hypothetical protein
MAMGEAARLSFDAFESFDKVRQAP